MKLLALFLHYIQARALDQEMVKLRLKVVPHLSKPALENPSPMCLEICFYQDSKSSQIRNDN